MIAKVAMGAKRESSLVIVAAFAIIAGDVASVVTIIHKRALRGA